MASRKKKVEQKPDEINEINEINEAIVEEIKEVKEVKEVKTPEKKEKLPKFKIGSVVYVSKDVNADLNGFNLSISQYKKETYTVEAYDADTGVYKVRHLKLLLRLKEGDLVAPDANAQDPLNRKQF